MDGRKRSADFTGSLRFSGFKAAQSATGIYQINQNGVSAHAPGKSKFLRDGLTR